MDVNKAASSAPGQHSVGAEKIPLTATYAQLRPDRPP